MNLPIALMVINGIHLAYSEGFYPGNFFIKGPTSKATIYGVDGSEIQSVADAGSISSQGIQGATFDASLSPSKDCDSDCAYKSGGSVVIKGPSTSAVIKGPSNTSTGNNGDSGTNYNQPSSYHSHQSHLINGKSDQITTAPCDSTTKDCGTGQTPLYLRTNSGVTISDLTVQSPSASQDHYKSVQFQQDVTRPCAGQNCATTQQSYGLHSSQRSPNVVIQGPSTSAFIKGPRSNGVALGKDGVPDRNYETSANQVHKTFQFTNYEKSKQIVTGPCDSSGQNCGTSQNPTGSSLGTNSNLGGWDVIHGNKPFSFPQTNSGGSYVIQGPSTSTFIKTFHGSTALRTDKSGSDTNQNNHSGSNKYSSIRSSTVDIQGPSTSAFIKSSNPFGTAAKSNVIIQDTSTSSFNKDTSGNGDKPTLESLVKKYAIPANLVYSGSLGTYKQRVQICDPSTQRCVDSTGITGGNKALGSQNLGIGTQSDRKIGIHAIYGPPAQTWKSSFSGGSSDKTVFIGNKRSKDYEVKYNAPADKGYFESSSFAPATYSKPDNSRQIIYQSGLPSSSGINDFTWESGAKQSKKPGYNCYVIKFSVPGHVAPSEYSTLLNKISRSVAKDFEHYSQYHQHHYNL